MKALYGLPKPETDLELSVLTEFFYGIKIRVKTLYCYYYEILQPYDEYKKYAPNYDTSLWVYVFGKTNCGGTAESQYASFDIKGYRHSKRIQKWIKNRENKINYLRRPFQRLADQKKGSEISSNDGV